jgi:hypothetical protein
MTKEQIRQARAAADDLSKSLPKVNGAAEPQSIGDSFLKPRLASRWAESILPINH